MAEWVRRRLRRSKVPGSKPAWTLKIFPGFFSCFFGACAKYFLLVFFCVNSTHALTHASNLRKCAKSYNERKFDAQSAHVARLRRYCANHKVAQFRRKIGAFWVLGFRKVVLVRLFIFSPDHSAWSAAVLCISGHIRSVCAYIYIRRLCRPSNNKTARVRKRKSIPGFGSLGLRSMKRKVPAC